MRTRSRHPLATSITAATTVALMLAAPVAAAGPTVTVKAGDTLSQIAVDHGTTVEHLTQANAIADPNRIFPGQELVLVPDAAPAPAVAAASPAAASAQLVHVVASGEHLTGIAARYGTTVAAVAAANGLVNPSFILPGQRLVVGAAPGAPAPAPAAPAAALVSAPAPASVVHTVASGETLTAIAQRYGTTITAIVSANGLANASFIRTGTQLTIPQPAAAAPTAAGPTPQQYAAMPVALRDLIAQRTAIGDAVQAEAQAIGLPPALAMAVAWQESGWQPGLTSAAGAVGVMQLLPSTGDWIAGSMLGSPVNVWDTASNIRAGVRLLKHYHDRYGGDRARILAAYYQGQYALESQGIYPVSWPYINAVTSLEAMFAS